MKNRLLQSTALTVPADEATLPRRSWAPLQIGAAAMLALSLVATPLTFDGNFPLTLTDSAAKAEGRGEDPFLRGQNRNNNERGDWINNEEGGGGNEGGEGGENNKFNEQGEGNDEFGDLGGDTELGEVGEEGGDTQLNEQGEGNDEFGDLGGDTELGEVGEEGGEGGWWPFN